jgi:hypothetical protein
MVSRQLCISTTGEHIRSLGHMHVLIQYRFLPLRATTLHHLDMDKKVADQSDEYKLRKNYVDSSIFDPNQ